MAKNITIIDGGMGQELLRRSGAQATALWSAQVMQDFPDIVRDLHRDYILSGAQMITLNSYTLSPERLARDARSSDFGPLQQKAIELAHAGRDLAGKSDVRIGGCLPPLKASYRPDEKPDVKAMVESCKRIVDVQYKHVDLFVCETMSSVAEATTAAMVAKETGLPVWVALSVEDDASANLRSGEPLSLAIEALDEIGVNAKLLNCSKPEAIDAAWKTLASGSGPIGAYANGFTSISALQPGGTVDTLSSRHDLGPEPYAEFVLNWMENGANIVGGCCEVGPEHIEVIARRAEEAGYKTSWPGIVESG